MATTLPAPTQTPSKKAADALTALSLNTPLKKMGKLVDVDEEREVAAIVAPPMDDEARAALRRKFVGEIDLEEKDEPLLTESRRRFVLFPIQYHEVRISRRGGTRR